VKHTNQEKKRRSCRWDDRRKKRNAKEEFRLCADAGLSLELADGEKKSVAGTTTKERTSMGSTDAREEDEDLVYKQATTTKESVAGTTTSKERRTRQLDR